MKKKLITSAYCKIKDADISVRRVCLEDGFNPQSAYGWLEGRHLPRPKKLRKFIESLNARGAGVRYEDFYSYEYYGG